MSALSDAKRWFWVGLLMLVGCRGVPRGAEEAADDCPPVVPANLPQAIAAPEGERPFLELFATGTQTYRCMTNADGVAAWGPAVPNASLHRCSVSGPEVGSHTAGPTWQWSGDQTSFVGDGSTVIRAASPDAAAGTIPWLLVSKKSSSPTGRLSAVSHVQRVNTVGGAAPTSGCDAAAAAAGNTAVVPYTAAYIFYQASN